jgi:excisionase family DNA binding protein
MSTRLKPETSHELPAASAYGIRSEPEERGSVRDLAHRLDRADTVRVSLDGDEPIALPPSVKEGLARVAAYLATSDFVAVQPMDRHLTTQEAADFLSVSRPYLIGLLGNEEKGKIPFSHVGPGGTHRRIRLADLLKFREERAALVGRDGEKILVLGRPDTPPDASSTDSLRRADT